MDYVHLVASTGAGILVGAVISSLATFALAFAISLVPAYVAASRKRFRRAVVLVWVVLVADLGILVFPPVGVAIWICALAYAFLPKKGRRHYMVRA